MNQKYTVEELKTKLFESTKGQITFVSLENYKNLDEKVLLLCAECNKTFSKSITQALQTKKVFCPLCSLHPRARSLENFKETLESFNMTLVRIVTNQSDTGTCIIRFNSCGCESQRFNGSVLRGIGKCQTHDRKPRYNTLSRVKVKEYLSTFKYGSFDLLGDFKGTSYISKFKCLKCEFITEESFAALRLRKGKCKNCFGSAASIHEEYISILLTDLGITFTRQFQINSFFFDFYLSSYHILIEYDGEQHRTKRFYNKKSSLNDKDKDLLAHSKGYTLYRISDLDNVLLSILKIYEDVQRLSSNGVGTSVPKDITTSLIK